ncbi:helix-turn-helix domain-containing protein [uncultured Mycobacterium sp.]|uniref:helix-turn-helix domain-containing protein n=1 Tax=uncultured Mycobacterium sp. TaxID=171292 RepID=UPI0035C9D301
MATRGRVDEATDWVLAGVGPRLTALRREQGTTLAALGRQTGISVSTLSRLESGRRRATLELLLPIARAHGVALDDLIRTRPADDPRVRGIVTHRDGMTFWRLSRSPGQPTAYKVLHPASQSTPPAQGATHEGYEWIYVLAGRLRLVLGEQDFILTQGEAAEFDTRRPHWAGSTGEGPVETLVLFGRQGEHAHLRVRPGGIGHTS